MEAINVNKIVNATQLDRDLTNVADSIRLRTGTNDFLSFPNDFINEIEKFSIDDENVKDVVFIDYDGTVVYTYTAAEFLELSELPPNPYHKGLIAQGWNWTLTDAQDYVSDAGFHVIGQNYTTDNGATKIYITVGKNDLDDPQYLNFWFAAGTELSIDWGDGYIETKIANSNTSYYYNHKYEAIGDYIISIRITKQPTDGNVIFGYYGANSGISWGNSVASAAGAERIKKIEIGNGFTMFGTQPLTHLYNLKSISIPTGIGNIPGGTALGEYGILKGLVLPDGFTYIGNNGLIGNYRYVSLPKSITTIGQNQYCRMVERMVIPNNATTTSTYTWRDCNCLRKLHLPSSMTNIPQNYIVNLYSLKEIVIPSAVTTITGSAFSGTRFQRIYLKPTTPPSLANVNAFPNLANTAIIYVPYSSDHSILNAYKTATNWSSFASKMQEEPMED